MTKLDVVEEIKKKLKEVEDNQIKLLDGYYKCHESLMVSWKVDGDAIDCKDPHEIYDFNPSIEYGDFGKRHISLIYSFFPTECFICRRGKSKVDGKVWKRWRKSKIQHDLEVFIYCGY